MGKDSWYCYICGKPIKQTLFLVSLMAGTDRAFLMCSEACKRQVQKPFYFRRFLQEKDKVEE